MINELNAMIIQKFKSDDKKASKTEKIVYSKPT